VTHASDSVEQLDAELLILATVSKALGVVFAPRPLTLPAGAIVRVDRVDADETVLVEVFAPRARCDS
jgi:hypothetical protein